MLIRGNVLYKVEESDIENGEIRVADNVKVIGVEAFYRSSVQRVILPKRLEIIDERAFAYCEVLESISFPEKLNQIGAWAFLNCSLLKSVCLPKSVKVVQPYAFTNCLNLKKVIIQGNTEIGEWCFDQTPLTDIRLYTEDSLVRQESLYTGRSEPFSVHIDKTEKNYLCLSLPSEENESVMVITKKNDEDCMIAYKGYWLKNGLVDRGIRDALVRLQK